MVKVRGIKSIEVSGRILSALAKKCAPMTLRELAEAAEMPPAQCHNYLVSLRQAQLVDQCGHTGLYRMGPMGMRLAISRIQVDPVLPNVISKLKLLTQETGLLSLLAVWGELGPTAIYVNEAREPTSLTIHFGTQLSVTGSASGRVFAAFGDAQKVESQIALERNLPLGFKGIGKKQNYDDFLEKVELVKEIGVSIADAMPIPGTKEVAIPIFDNDGALKFSASIIVESNNFELSPDSEIVKRLINIG